jgi:hypothetical protein
VSLAVACADKPAPAPAPSAQEQRGTAAAERQRYFADPERTVGWLRDHLARATSVVGYAIEPEWQHHAVGDRSRPTTMDRSPASSHTTRCTWPKARAAST